MKEIFENFSQNRKTLKWMISSESYLWKYHHSLEYNKKDDNAYPLGSKMKNLTFKISLDNQCHTDR